MQGCWYGFSVLTGLLSFLRSICTKLTASHFIIVLGNTETKVDVQSISLEFKRHMFQGPVILQTYCKL